MSYFFRKIKSSFKKKIFQPIFYKKNPTSKWTFFSKKKPIFYKKKSFFQKTFLKKNGHFLQEKIRLKLRKNFLSVFTSV